MTLICVLNPRDYYFQFPVDHNIEYSPNKVDHINSRIFACCSI